MNRLVVLLLLAAVVLSAQGMPPRGGAFPWWDSPLVRDLNLTEDQQQQIKNTVREYRNKLIEARAAAEKAEGDLNDVYEEDRIDQRRANDAIERIVAARGDLTRTFSLMSLRLRGVLTVEQWRELQKRRPQMEFRRGSGAPGTGPGPRMGLGGPQGPKSQNPPPQNPPPPQD